MSVTASLNTVTYGNGKFVAAGWNSTVNNIVTSPDGITWTEQTGPAVIDWRGLTYGNGVFVAVGYGGDVCYIYRWGNLVK